MSPDDVVTALTTRNEHVLLPADVPRVMLDGIAAKLAAQRSRVLRPVAAEVLTLPGLLAELVAQAPDTAPDVATTVPDLERGFELLTDPGTDCQRVVLMLDQADALDPAALRYVQFAAHGAPLRLLFAGGQGLHALLEREEFGLLRRRFIGYAPSSSLGSMPKPAAPMTSFVAAPTPSRVSEGFHAEAFPGGAEAALQFAAFEKNLAESGRDRHSPNWHDPNAERPTQRDAERPIQWQAPISEPDRRSSHWLLAGAGMAVFAAVALWLINSGLLVSYLAGMLRATTSP